MDSLVMNDDRHCGTRCSYFSMALVQRLRPIAVPYVQGVVGALLAEGQDVCLQMYVWMLAMGYMQAKDTVVGLPGYGWQVGNNKNEIGRTHEGKSKFFGLVQFD